jgi:hypothetical protein
MTEESAALADKTMKLTELLTELCSTPDEAFKVLGHVTVALLHRIIEMRHLAAPADERLVAQYCLEIAAGMERFGGPSIAGVAAATKLWVASGHPAPPEVEKIIQDVLTRDGGTIVDLEDAGRNDPCGARGPLCTKGTNCGRVAKFRDYDGYACGVEHQPDYPLGEGAEVLR